MSNIRIVLDSSDGCGKTTISKLYEQKDHYRYIKFLSNNVTEHMNVNNTSIYNEMRNIITKHFSEDETDINYLINQYQDIIKSYRHISEIFLDSVYTSIGDQSKLKDDNILRGTRTIIQDRGLFSIFFVNYMEYRFYTNLAEELSSMHVFEQVYIDIKLGVFTNKKLNDLIEKTTKSIVINMTSDINMKHIWDSFNDLILNKSRYHIYYDIPFNTLSVILTMDDEYRLKYILNEKSEGIVYKKIFELPDFQIRLNYYVAGFKEFFTDGTFKKPATLDELSNVIFMPVGYRDNGEYKRFTPQAIKNMIDRELVKRGW